MAWFGPKLSSLTIDKLCVTLGELGTDEDVKRRIRSKPHILGSRISAAKPSKRYIEIIAGMPGTDLFLSVCNSTSTHKILEVNITEAIPVLSQIPRVPNEVPRTRLHILRRKITIPNLRVTKELAKSPSLKYNGATQYHQLFGQLMLKFQANRPVSRGNKY